jgi:two-component system CheB/CheR fusion protein
MPSESSASPADEGAESVIDADAVADSESSAKSPVEDAPKPPSPFPVVGIGASAGGVDALRRFFRHVPSESDMAFVVVLHLAPDHESNLAAILDQDTTMPVAVAEDGTRVQPNHVYVIPPGRRLDIEDGRLRLTETEGPHDVSTVDGFFRSLAADQGASAVGIVLSGTGSDGAIGLQALKEEGGITMVQDPDAAEYGGMPHSAVTSTLVDLVLPVEGLAEKLVTYRNAAGVIQLPDKIEALGKEGKSTLQKIFTRLYTETGHDFSTYKRSVILRRLERRLKIHALSSLDDYLQHLRDDAEEVHALYKDLLIGVTHFFRDPESFEALQEQVVPEIFEGKSAGDQIRVWVVGCATGEEAYSLAMLLVEYAETLDHPPEIQLFATDVDEEALQVAREGRYPESIRADVPEERLQRFFELEGDQYRVDLQIRDRILFAKHNVLMDPPFSNLDLVSCRNLLIYFEPETQEHVFTVSHYGLNEGGYLFLGRSEAGSRATGLFSTVNTSNSILKARVLPDEQRTGLPFGSDVSVQRPGRDTVPAFGASGEGPAGVGQDEKPESLKALYHRVLMQEVAGLLVNENHEIVYTSDRAHEYLRPEGGVPTHDLFLSVPEPLRLRLRSTLFQVFKKGTPVEYRQSVPEDEGTRRLLVSVRALEGQDGTDYAHIRFEELPAPETEESMPSDAETGREAALEEELKQAREQLQNVTEEYEAASEEMEAANEELLSMNEELQSKNEELETSKEEMKSVNEELQTTNQELKSKIEMVRETNSLLKNLIDATQIATLFLNKKLQIRQFTPQIQDLFNIQPADEGRSLADFTQRFEYEGLMDDARAVLRTLEPIEREVCQDGTTWFLVQLRPYRTVEDKIDGVVIAFVDITERKVAERSLRRSEEFHRLAVEAGQVGTWVVHRSSGACYLSAMMVALMGYDPASERTPDGPWALVVSQDAWLASIHPEDRPAMEAALETAFETESAFELEVRIQNDDGTVRWLHSKGAVTRGMEEDGLHLRGASTDVTEQKQS